MNQNSLSRQIIIIIQKNIKLQMKNITGLIGQFILPLMVSLMLYLFFDPSFEFIKINIYLLLPFYLGTLGSGALRKFLMYLITEREQFLRRYQNVLGLSQVGYILGNILYIYSFTLFILSPVIFTTLYYNFQINYIFYFFVFIIASSNQILLFSSCFKDGKLAVQTIGILYSLCVFTFYFIQTDQWKFHMYLVMLLPQPSFAFSVLYEQNVPSLISFGASFIFLLIYLYVQYQINPFRCLIRLINTNNQLSSEIVEEIELDDVENRPSIEQSLNINKQILIRIQSVKKKYHNQYALNGLSLKIHEGEILTLLGKNGAGKTTLIDLITKISYPTSGIIEMKRQQKIGICYQNQILYEELTVEQILTFYIDIKNANIEEIQQTLTQVNLLNQRQKKVKELSGGMKRRLSIAIAIAGNPNILIFDQPTSGLDPQFRRQIWQIFKLLKSKNKTILLTTHHLDEAQILADRIAIIQKGNLLVLATPNFIKKKFGIGYNLTIEGGIDQKQQEKIISNYITLEKSKSKHLNVRKYILRMDDQNKFPLILQELQKIKDLQMNLQLNTLEQAFLMILNDPSIISNVPSSNLNFNLERSETSKSRALYAMIIKNLYNFKSNLLRSIMMYNLNLILLLVGIVISRIMLKSITQQQNQQQYDPKKNQVDISIKKLMLLQGYYFSIGIYIYFPVYEKQKNIIGVLRVKGLNWGTYWFSFFIQDFTMYLLNLIFIKLIVGDIIDGSLYVFFGASMILYAYLLSNLFKTAKNAVKYFPLINFLFGLLIPLFSFIQNDMLRKIILELARYLYPFYSVQQNLTGFGQSNKMFKYYIFQIFFYGGLIAFIQLSIIQRIRNKKNIKFIQQDIKFQNITKNYGDNTALHQINLVVQKRQVLALLGPNGAGKSTSFKLLTNNIQPSSGEIYLEGKLHPPYVYTFNSTGVCYQDDTLWQKLTVRQILKIFGELTGVVNIKKESEWLFDQLEMEHFDKMFKNLSGGNKRKCCLAVALIGKPNSVFLDQCSTGLDAMSRRSMIQVLSMEQSSVVFTTHSMNEAQAICDKVAILMKGNLIENETIKQLKNKYYPSYFIDVFGKNNLNQIEKILGQFVEYKILSMIQQQSKMKLEINKNSIKISKLYQQLYHLKSKQIISDFSVYEPNLQDIYLKITTDNV